MRSTTLARGDRQELIFEDDEDRHAFLDVLGTVVEDFNWLCHAYHQANCGYQYSAGAATGRAPSLARIAKAHPDRNRAILAAHATGEYSYAQIAQHFGAHFTTVGRIVRAGRSFRRQVKD